MLANFKNLFFIFVIVFIFAGLTVATDKVFVVFSAPRVIEFQHGEFLIIAFNKPIKRQEIEHAIFPKVYGEWRFEDPIAKNHLFKKLVFIPAVDFQPGTEYAIELKNIRGFGLKKSSFFKTSFTTQNADIEENIKKSEKSEKAEKAEKAERTEELEVTIIDIPIDWQDYALSCEAASLKMALARKGVFVSEDEIMDKIGFDLSSREKNVWGDPYQKYVGDIKGKMCKTGYGVYWEPVGEAANYWRESESFSFWNIKKLIEEIKKGNPIIFWGALPVKSLTDCSWQTSDGKYIRAFKETHVRLVVGFIGSENNPQQIIINDPLSGRLYWETDYFLENWKVFNYSGVVVR